ncbi:zinc ABC transporter substrate-binding protein ZnuA [Pokkaliibacter sp. CJK22405]|uniref:zinc ABC transporter substrate-binding protein ZnuA n=1 Tax=Pokkaliibacter sp. CJK22405 TaxID=3384615 RepID=UPI003984DF90
MKIPAGMALAALLAASGSAHADAPQVLTTLKPLQLIAAAITDGVSAPELLVAPGASPHDYALKPSDSRKLASADLLVWVGPDMEAFVARSAEQKKPEQLLTLAEVLNLKERGKEEDHDEHHDEHADHEDHDHDEHADHDGHDDHEEEAEEGHHHHHGGYNPHMWTSPEFAVEAAHALADRLRELDPEHAERYVENYKTFEEAVNAEDAKIKAELAPVKSTGYFVFHDAYHYFEEHYALNHLGEFTVNPERQPGAKHLAEIRHELEEGKARCVFTEPQFVPAVVESITHGLNVKQAALDPLATDIPVSAQGYVHFLDDIAGRFKSCLQ